MLFYRLLFTVILLSGTFFNFASLEFAENPVEIVLTGPDDSSSQVN